MANINISDLDAIGSDLFSDPESFLSDLSDNELGKVNGGLQLTLYNPSIIEIVNS
jgi:hypothetical protein